MNYKSIIRNQQLRFKILRALTWIPDSLMLRLQYFIKMGFWPNFGNPKRFTEKIQLYKMKYRNPVMHQCVDKYEVRKYVESKGLGNILNELYGVYELPDKIDFSILPEKFVIKTTDGSGGQNVIIVKNKNEADFDDILQRLCLWHSRKKSGASLGREWAYEGQYPPRIIIERYLENSADRHEYNISQPCLTDYKFFCFNGEPKYLYVVSDRKPGEYAYLGVYDIDFNKLPVYRCDECRAEQVETKPKNYEQMVEIARKLSVDFPHVRVDLYNIDGKIFFGELTFYDGSGYFHYGPDEFDFEMGQCFTEYGI